MSTPNRRSYGPHVGGRERAGLPRLDRRAHPGGGVHGAPGANAARAALRGPVARSAVASAQRARARRRPS
ncbi:hypothetical protein [Streptomyces sp. NBC_01477]|uniref:hypothetical protein n=1 Tax=Streptomyces sp. NBC_01477 TaxID=2976015 RepID=UPI002E31739F|nr:hypothetical protein [Streptomyces sp. NBC_01477]